MTDIVEPAVNSEDSTTTQAVPIENPNGGETVNSEALTGLVIDGFNPAIHATDESGAPIVTASGGFRKKPGRKPKDGNTVQSSVTTKAHTASSTPATTAAPKTKLDYAAQKAAAQAIARQIVMTGVGAMVVAVGDEWQMESKEEQDAMIGAIALYIEAKGDVALSPESMLMLTMTSYALPRFQHQNTRTKFGKFFGKMKDGFKSFINATLKIGGK
jgi:hypothetical protein